MTDQVLGLWVDDERAAPCRFFHIKWHIARSYEEALDLLQTFKYNYISLDHDLGCIDEVGNEKTGDDILTLLAEQWYQKEYVPEIWIHTANYAKYQRVHNVADKLNQPRII